MKNINQKQGRKYHLSTPLTILFFAAITIYIMMATVYIQPGLFRNSIRSILEIPSLFLLNFLPVLALVCIGYFLTGNVFISGAISSAICLSLSYANLLKMSSRNDPLVPTDLPLLRESLTALDSYNLELHPVCIVLITVSLVGMILFAFRFSCAKPCRLVRLAGCIGTIIVMLAAMMTIYSDKDYYNQLPNVDKSNVPLVYNTYGFAYCFLYNYNLYPVDKPEGYNQKNVEEWSELYLEAAEPLDVDILFVMGEAFSDLSLESAFLYSEEESPIYLYQQLATSDQAISGHIVVPNIGAGTANTEFDVMTGMQTAMLSPNTTSAFRTVHRNLESLARIYSAKDYSTWFMHPGTDWFYNRNNVYTHLGIPNQTFNEAFADEPMDGSFLSDQAFLHVLKDNWDAQTQDNTNLFAYTVTIENHQAYTYAKYYTPIDETVPLAVSISDAALENLSVYFYGVRHTSEMVYSLAEYLNTLSRPTLLVFFGDHRPSLGADYLAYREIGSPVGLEESPEQVIYSRQTPFIIWGNTAFCQSYNMQELEEALSLPIGNKISANYLGSLVYELTGMTGSSSYWDYLTQARRILPVLHGNSYYLPNGTYTSNLTEEQADVVRRLDWWEYYRMKK